MIPVKVKQWTDKILSKDIKVKQGEMTRHKYDQLSIQDGCVIEY